MKIIVLALIGLFGWRRLSPDRRAEIRSKVPFLAADEKTKARAKLADLRGSLLGRA